MTDLAGRTTGGTVSVFVVLAVVALLLAVLGVAALWRTFADAGERGWAAVVPVYNVIVLLRVTGKPTWWVVPYLVPVLGLIVVVPTWAQVARGYGRGRWATAGLVLAQPVAHPLLAFGTQPYRRPADDVPPAHPLPRAPWAGAAASAVLVTALVLGYFLATDRAQPTGALTEQQSEAVTAAGTIAANLQTFSRANFAHDYARALNQTIGSLHSDVAKLRTTTQQTLTSNKIDLSATARHSAYVGSSEPSPTSKSSTTSYVVLVSLYGYRSDAPAVPIPQNLEVTVERSKGQWVASDATQVSTQ